MLFFQILIVFRNRFCKILRQTVKDCLHQRHFITSQKPNSAVSIASDAVQFYVHSLTFLQKGIHLCFALFVIRSEFRGKKVHNKSHNETSSFEKSEHKKPDELAKIV